MRVEKTILVSLEYVNETLKNHETDETKLLLNEPTLIHLRPNCKNVLFVLVD